MLKFNSSCRYHDSFCRRMIQLDAGMAPEDYCIISVWPWEEPNWPKVSIDPEKMESVFSVYTLYNPIGSMLIQILMPALEKIGEIKDRILI